MRSGAVRSLIHPKLADTYRCKVAERPILRERYWLSLHRGSDSNRARWPISRRRAGTIEWGNLLDHWIAGFLPLTKIHEHHDRVMESQRFERSRGE